MTENTEPDHEAKIEPGIENKDTEPPIQIEEIEQDMEVHHHPQLHHNPKPWKEYLLEGLMIFIAVSLGFFAEQLREHFVESKREKEYVQSLYNDLKADTAIIQRTYDEKSWILAKYDSAENILGSNNITPNNEFIYYMERYLNNNDVFTSQDVTYQQLKSSGNFRYIKTIALYKRIADYYSLYLQYQSIDGNFYPNKKETIDLEAKLFNAKDLASLDNPNPSNFYNLVLRPNGKTFEPIEPDKQNLNNLYLRFADAKSRTIGSTVFLNWLKRMATELLKELSNEYHLD